MDTYLRQSSFRTLLYFALLLVFSCSAPLNTGGEHYSRQIATNPSGAKIYIDGEFQGYSPFSLDFGTPQYTDHHAKAFNCHWSSRYEGKEAYDEALNKDHVLEIKMDGYESVVITFKLSNLSQKIRDLYVLPVKPTATPTESKLAQQQMQQQMMGPTIVIGGQTVTGEAAVKIKEYGLVNFQSVPDGAEIYIENNLIGNAPISQLRFEKGTFNITAKMKGHKDWKRQIMIIENSTITIKAELEKQQ